MKMSLELSSNGSLGLSELIVRQLGGDTENFTPNSLLSSNQQFKTKDTGIALGDTEACLSGEVTDGTPFTACDNVDVKDDKNKKDKPKKDKPDKGKGKGKKK